MGSFWKKKHVRRRAGIKQKLKIPKNVYLLENIKIKDLELERDGRNFYEKLKTITDKTLFEQTYYDLQYQLPGSPFVTIVNMKIPQHLIRLFRQISKLSPRQYRKFII